MAVQMLLALRTEVTRVFVLRICSLMHTATSELVMDEDWEPVAAVQRISSPFTISSLPLRFQELMVSALDHLTEYVSPSQEIQSFQKNCKFIKQLLLP